MRPTFTARVFRQRALAVLASIALAVTSQGLIAVSATAAETDSANSAVDYAGVFDGSSSNTVSAAATSVIPTSGEFTLEAWIYPTASISDTNTRVIFSQGTNSDGEFWVGRAQGNISIFDSGRTRHECGPTPSNAWSHIAISRTATTLSCFINGALAYTKSAAFTANVGTRFTVGSWTPNLTDVNTYWQGQLDQVKVWNGNLTESQLAESMHDYSATGVTASPTLLAHYDFNEGTNTDQKLYNRAGAGLDLTSPNLTFADVKTVVNTGNIDPNRTLVYKFPRTYLTAQGGWSVPGNMANVEILAVGGGGGGGENVGNGGSGGSSTYHSGLTLGSGSLLTVKVGQGGRPGAHVDDSMVGATAATWQQDSTGTANTSVVSTRRDGGTGQASSVVTDAATLTAPGGLGGMTYWDSNACAGGSAAHTGGTTPAAAAGSGGTANNVGGAGGQGFLTTGTPAGVAAATTYTISGANYRFGGGGAGADGSGTSVSGAANGGGATSATSYVRGGAGDANSGGGGAGGLTGCTPGGAGGSGVVYVRTLPVSINAINGGANSTKSIASVISGPAGIFSVALSSTVGTFNILAGDLTTSGATKTGGSGSEKFITYQGTIEQLRAAVAATKFTLAGAPVTGAIKIELNPVVADTSTIFFNQANGHYYKYVNSTADYATAASSAANSANNYLGLNGYLTNLTSAAEQTFQASVITFASKPNLWIGAREVTTNGNWIWYDGPEAGTQILSSNYPTKTVVNGAYNNFNATEPNNNSGTTGADDCAVGNFTAAHDWDDVACAATTMAGSIIEFGGRSTDPGVSSAAVTVTLAQVNVAFTELNFDYTATKYVNLKKLNVDGGDATLAGSTISATNSTGKVIGDRVLFKAVTVRDGKTIDALVTTRRIVSATITNYETGARAGGVASSFQTDVDINANNGYAEFQFDFFETDANIVANCNATVACTGSNKVILQNVNVSIFDIDYYQWNDITGMDSYTVSNPTNLKACLVSGLTPSTTCTANNTITTFPAEIRYQGPSGIDATLPEDMAIANYGSMETFRVKFGRSISGTPNYYGITFKALSWGGKATQTVGPPASLYDLVYSGNGKTGGTVPATQSSAIGAEQTVAANSGTLAKTGYTFAGWNTAADGSGTAYAAGSKLLMPVGGLTLYAVWTPGQYTLTYSPNSGTSAPASSLNNAGSSITLSATVPTRAGYTFGGWNTLANGTGTNYASSAAYTMPGANTTLYAKWTSASSTIAYNANGSSSGSAPSSSTGTAGSSTTVSANTGTLAKTGHTFAGWNTAADGSGTDYAGSAAINYPASGTLTLYAKWTANSYTVAYNSNGGSSAPGSSSVLYGSTVSVVSSASNPTRSGYNFAGWNTVANGSGTAQAAGSTFVMPANNVTLFAQWTAINYNATYNGNAPSGQSVTGSQSDATNYISGATVTALNAGTLAVTGYRFVGWNTRADGTGSDYVAGGTLSMPVGGITLYAKWVLSSIRLTFDANLGAGAPPAETQTAGSTVNLPTTVPTRAGYTFGGWNTAANGSGTNYASNASYVIPGSDTVLYAKWTAINYALSYDANGGSGAPAAVINQVVNTLITLSNTIPNWIGYTFLGWNTAANGGGTDYTSGATFTMPASDFTLFAKWQGNAFTLFYNGNNGGSISPSSVARTAGSVANVSSSVPVRAGYTFAGWNTAANGSGSAYTAGSSLTMPGSDLTLYAQWSIASSAVNYDANGGSGAPSGSSSSIGQTVTVSSTIPTRTGYSFTGWNTVANGSGTPYSAADTFTMGATSITLYAQWSTAAYSLSYNANAGTAAPGAQNYNYSATATVSSVLPTRTGYDFLGWNSQADGLGTAYAASATFTMPASNVVLYAQWTLATYTVYYNANNGVGVIANQAGRFGTGITLTATTPTRTGYTFAGWNTQAAGAGTSYASSAAFTIPAGNTILFAQWTPRVYSLDYDANGGTAAPAQVTGLNAGQSITLSATAPTRTGYYFTGWNTAMNGSGQNYAVSSVYVMPASATTIYAQWSLNTYSVSFNANGGTGAPVAQQTDGSGNVTVPATTPTRPGYTFVTWNTQVGGGGTTQAPSSTFAPSGNLVLYAQWTANNITITYDMNGGTGTAPSNSTGAFGTTLQLEGFATFSKANAVFVSWNTIADGSGVNYQSEEPNFALPATDITLYAIWSGTNFAIEYNPNGGANEPGTQYVTPGNNVNIPPAEPVRPGYVFGGWQEVSTGNVYGTGAGLTMPTSNMVMVAIWVSRASLPRSTSTATPSPTPTPTPTTPTVTAPKKLTITVYFKGDSAVLTTATKTALKKLAVQAKANGRASSITIIGRVKETNDKSYDKRLSNQRAVNVAKYLKQLGVVGTYKVIAAGISPENKPVSRRVDGVLIWK
ncbi:MAG: hypothetical protein RIS66_494 [Actinomycetota bacterium]|jgi:uncharacterized repeat protein (TIGR02543 family)